MGADPGEGHPTPFRSDVRSTRMGAHAHVHKRPRASAPTVNFTGLESSCLGATRSPYEGTRTCCKGSDLRFRAAAPAMPTLGRCAGPGTRPAGARPSRGLARRGREHTRRRSPRPGTRGPTGSSSTSTGAPTARSSSTTTPRSTASGSSPSTTSPTIRGRAAVDPDPRRGVRRLRRACS